MGGDAGERDLTAMLPDELKVEILRGLSPVDVCRISQVASHWVDVAHDRALWREFCVREYGFLRLERYSNSGNWFECFRKRAEISKRFDKGVVGTFDVHFLKGHAQYVTEVLLLESGRVATASADHTARVWDPADNECKLTLEGHTGAVTAAAEAAGRLVTASDDSTLRVWSLASGDCLSEVRAHDGPVTALAAVGSSVFSAGTDRFVKHWSLPAAGAPATRLSCRSSRATGAPWRGEVVLWDVRQDISFRGVQGRRLGALAGPTGAVTHAVHLPSADRLLAASADRSLWLWDVATGQRVTSCGGPGAPLPGVTCLEWDGQPACDRAYSAHEDGSVRAWDLRARAPEAGRTLATHAGGPAHALQVDGYKAVSGGADNFIRVFDLRAGAQRYGLQGGSLQQRRRPGGGGAGPHPTKQGVTAVRFDACRIVAAIGPVVNNYSFDG
eukprot:tig00001471_g8865.t1